MGLVGPSLMDITQWLEVSDQMISYSRAILAICTIVAALSATYIYRWFRRDRSIIFALFLHGVATLCVPLFRNYGIYVTLVVINGMGYMISELGMNVWSLDLYKEKNATPLQIMHFCNGIGGVVASVVVSQYVTDPDERPTIQIHADNDTSIAITPPLSQDERWHNLKMIYGIGCTGALVSGVYMLSLLIASKLHKKMKSRPSIDKIISNGEQDSNASQSSSDASSSISKSLRLRYRMWALVWAILMLGAQMGMDLIAYAYLPTVFDKEHFGRKTAVNINTAKLVAANVARFVAVIASTRISPRTIIISLTTLVLGSTIALFFTVGHPESPIWSYVFTVTLGIGISSVFASMFSYINSKFRITNRNSGFMFGFIGIVMAVDPILVGRFINELPTILLIIILAHCGLIIVSFIMIEISFKIFDRHPKKYYQGAAIEPANVGGTVNPAFNCTAANGLPPSVIN